MTWVIVDWDCKTHLPALRAVMDLYAPEFVLEMGIGIHSTPVLLEYPVKYIGIENDMEWVDLMNSKVEAEIIFHPLDSSINAGTPLSSLTKEQTDKISNYYKSLKIPAIRPNLLFVDQWTCNRVLSINALRGKFDIIIYHDCEPAGIIEYSYDRINSRGFNTYILKSAKSWTGIMIRQKIDKGFNLLKDAISPHIIIFMNKYPESNMTL